MSTPDILSWRQFVQWLFYGLLSIFGSIVSAFLFNIQVSMKELSNSIIELNRNMAIMVTTTQFQQKELEDHAQRIERLERVPRPR